MEKGYHDYLLVSRRMIDSTERYIAYNPQKWELMYGVADALRIKEPIFRRVCLDLNAEIVEIATAENGLAVYWKADGPHILRRIGPDNDGHSEGR